MSEPKEHVLVEMFIKNRLRKEELTFEEWDLARCILISRYLSWYNILARLVVLDFSDMTIMELVSQWEYFRTEARHRCK